MARYRLRLHLPDGDQWDVSVDESNRWELPADAFETEEDRADAAEAVAGKVADSLLTDPPGYLPMFAMRYAIQALTAYPGSEPLFEVPFTDDPLVHY
ncbi:MAG: hypothetical protein F4X16_13345 [Caldilineaceae bacterium SB0661_bin_34]|nr:hypothetical protein [Caldilineaceae bacterium SB0661_bin_34]